MGTFYAGLWYCRSFGGIFGLFRYPDHVAFDGDMPVAKQKTLWVRRKNKIIDMLLC